MGSDVDFILARVATHVHRVAIGSHDSGDQHRNINSFLLKHGWDWFDGEMIRPAVQRGAKRFLMMDWAGRGPLGEVEWDAPLNADNLSQGKMRFVEFARIMRDYRHAGIEPISYKGNPSVTRGMVYRRENPRVWLQRFLDSCEVELEARCSFCIDWLNHQTDDAAKWGVGSDQEGIVLYALKMLEKLIASYGGRIYGENAENVRQSVHWRDTPSITWWHGQKVSGGPEVICSDGDNESPQRVRQIIEAGMTPMYRVHWMKVGVDEGGADDTAVNPAHRHAG